MSSYEVRINEIHRSNVAIGDHATAGGTPAPPDRDEMKAALTVLLAIVTRLPEPQEGEPDSGAGEVLDLACAARGEIQAAEPDKDVFRRLVDATRKMMVALGSKIIEAGALADAVAKIADLTRHL
ncbi:MAG TPA: hypothetical protein VN897_11370 [Mycobacterium sp.]|jgi:hypothetical protein|nr:hypothetical protein [Mycobacterium sp.]